MSFIQKIKPDFSSRGVAEPPPDLSGRSAPPPVSKPVGDGVPFNYNKPASIPEFKPVFVVPKSQTLTRVLPEAVSQPIQNSGFSPSIETYPTSGTSYYLTNAALAKDIGTWSRYPAVQDVDMSGNSLLNASTVAAEFVVSAQALISSFGGYTAFDSLAASAITSGTVVASSISSEIGTISSFTTRAVNLDGNILTTAGTNELLLNGVPIATTANISSLADWAYDPAASTVIMGANPISFGDDVAKAYMYANGDGAAFISTIDDIYLEGTQIRVRGVLDAPNIGNLSTIEGQATAPVVLNNFGQGWVFQDYVSVSTLQDVSTINGQPILTTLSAWSEYPATQDVDMASHNLNSTNQVNLNTGGNAVQLSAGTGNSLLINGTPIPPPGNASDWANYPAVSSINVAGNNILADNGANILGASAVNIIAKNGLNGAINLTADPGYGGISGGAINMTANGGGAFAGLYGKIALTANEGTVDGVTTGGLISLTANSGGAIQNLTSAVKITAGSVVSYAGVVNPIGSLFGYNYVYGTAGVSLTAGLPPGALQTPGTVYVYGTSGIVLNSDVYTTNVYPYWSGLGAPADLTIHGRTTIDGSASVKLSNVATMSMEGSGAITGLQTINGSAYPPVYATPPDLLVSTLTVNPTGYINVSTLTGVSTINGLPPTNISTAAGVFSGTVRFSRDSNVFLFSDPTTNTLTYGLNSNISSLNSITIDEPDGFISVSTLRDVSTINGLPVPVSIGANPSFSTVTVLNQQYLGYSAGGVGAPITFQSDVAGLTFYNMGIQNIVYTGSPVGGNTPAMTNELLYFAPLALSELIVYGPNVNATSGATGMTLSTDGAGTFLVDGLPISGSVDAGLQNRLQIVPTLSGQTASTVSWTAISPAPNTWVPDATTASPIAGGNNGGWRNFKQVGTSGSATKVSWFMYNPNYGLSLPYTSNPSPAFKKSDLKSVWAVIYTKNRIPVQGQLFFNIFTYDIANPPTPPATYTTRFDYSIGTFATILGGTQQQQQTLASGYRYLISCVDTLKLPAQTTATVVHNALVVGTVYTILTVGGSDFTTAGAAVNAVGCVFTAINTGAATGGSGTATYEVISTSGGGSILISGVQVPAQAGFLRDPYDIYTNINHIPFSAGQIVTGGAPQPADISQTIVSGIALATTSGTITPTLDFTVERMGFSATNGAGTSVNVDYTLSYA